MHRLWPNSELIQENKSLQIHSAGELLLLFPVFLTITSVIKRPSPTIALKNIDFQIMLKGTKKPIPHSSTLAFATPAFPTTSQGHRRVNVRLQKCFVFSVRVSNEILSLPAEREGARSTQNICLVRFLKTLSCFCPILNSQNLEIYCTF